MLILGLTVGLLNVARAAANGNVDPEAKWAWSSNASWINFSPPDGGVRIYRDHLEGYGWGENVGWIRLGTYAGGGLHTYANTAANNYGVNRTISNTLTGYAWGTNVGWINFDPDGAEGVTIDPLTGDFSGYAWGENVGWINFSSAGPPAYGVSMIIHRIYLSLVLRN